MKFSLDKTISINVIGVCQRYFEKISIIFRSNFPNKFKIKNDFKDFENWNNAFSSLLGLKNEELRSIKKILNLNAINFSGIVIFDKQSINKFLKNLFYIKHIEKSFFLKKNNPFIF